MEGKKKKVSWAVEKSRKIVFQLPLFKVSLSWWIEDAFAELHAQNSVIASKHEIQSKVTMEQNYLEILLRSAASLIRILLTLLGHLPFLV